MGVGERLGLSVSLATVGQNVPNPRHLGLAQRKLRRLQRQAARRVGPDRRSGQRPSHRWRKTAAGIALLHTKIAHARGDGLHKLTSGLVRRFGTIVVEDLNVSGMLRNRRLARRVADAGMGELRRMVGYKTDWSGTRLVVADHWYPSSKTCSGCGAVKTKLPLRVRLYRCDECGLVLDRDLNAARNLAALVGETASSTSTASCAGTLSEPDGNPCQTHSVWAAGIATGRPAPPGAGQRRRRKATTA
ncbi:RNA-guided endonuclease TnpB family protein [Lentzea nigeriaca]|uniref:RNA-guided endonuclease TnpB family protein n=1 Tax=Lentzea nigeriaca TaxID=1128665 RepID=UPI00195B4524|nr:RNA-guided endonuclease TnpB family protein [Lentzea nigeriaca]MBM7859928.1 IS605 OrfB family transposase [Lentzea nigeriaca]